MTAKEAKASEDAQKFPQDHPFSLLTLIQPSRPPNLLKREEGRLEGRAQGATPYLEDPYRPVQHCQTVAADLSLHPPHFPPPPDPPHLFYPLLPPRPPLPYEFYPPGPPDSYTEGGLGGPQATQQFPEYQEYYDSHPCRLPYTYDDPVSLALPENRQQYDFSLKVEDSFPSFPGQQQQAALLPPLHPSPAVLLHIKYVMESVCEAMFITDITIQTATDTLRAHRSILSAHSAHLAFLLASQDGEEEPVLCFPHHSSLVVRMLLQFFYTGEVSTMTQRDIEPLREICMDLGISALMARLEDVKLSISFQQIPGPGQQVLDPGQQASLGQSADCIEEVEEKVPGTEAEASLPSSCKFEQQPEARVQQADQGPAEGPRQPRRYTVVSKMPRDTKLQTNVKCPKCDLKFFKPDILKDHLKLHEGKKAKQCSVCHKSFNSNYHFQTHMRTHSHEKPYCCAVKDCGKEFVDSSSLRRHQVIHSGKKGFKCSICSKAFTDRSSRKRHEDLHANPVNISCFLCNKKFTRKSQLVKHIEKLHPNTDSRAPEDTETSQLSSNPLHECIQCKAVFKRASKLAQHMLVHSGVKPYSCDECEKSFARKTNLQLHKRTHTGERPHACARCGRCFSDVSAFRRHCRTHTGERPYSCAQCGATFTQASTLYNHKKTCTTKRVKSTENDQVKELNEKCVDTDG